MHTYNLRITHKKADVATLEAFSFPDLKKAMREVKALDGVEECVIVQTCNRVEIFAAVKDVSKGHHVISGYLMNSTIPRVKERLLKQNPDISSEDLLKEVRATSKKIHDAVEEEYHSDALLHLVRLSTGLESMIVGEDQILGQIKDAYNEAQKAKTIGPFLKNIFLKAINVGKRARNETEINKGAVSIGSAGVELAESILGTLRGKNALLVGAGEMGKLVAKALSEHGIDMIFVANRTYERGVELAQKLDGIAMKFEDLEKGIRNSDLVISATASQHPIIMHDLIEKAMDGRVRNELIIIDLGAPRNVEKGVDGIEGVRLLNIDDLRTIAEKNKKLREKEAVKVEKIIEEELALLKKQLYHVDVEDIIKSLFEEAESVRLREVERAFNMLGDGVGERELKIIDDLTQSIIKKTTSPIADKIRKAAECGDEITVQVGKVYFMNDFTGIKKKNKAGSKNVSHKKDEKTQEKRKA